MKKLLLFIAFGIFSFGAINAQSTEKKLKNLQLKLKKKKKQSKKGQKDMNVKKKDGQA